MTVRWQESSPTGSISHVMRVVPSALTSSPQSARMVWTSFRGGSTSMFSPSPRGSPPSGAISNRDPGVQSELMFIPNWYLLRISLSVMASQSRSGEVLM